MQMLLISFSAAVSDDADPLDSRSSGGSASRPRLALQKRTLPIEQPLPPPSTSRSGSETDEKVEKAEPLVVPRTGPRSNPFGNAKPVAVKEKVDPPPVRCAFPMHLALQPYGHLTEVTYQLTMETSCRV